MKRLVILVTVASLLAAPLAAQTLSILLPALTFPATVTTIATMDCAPTEAPVCTPQK